MLAILNLVDYIKGPFGTTPAPDSKRGIWRSRAKRVFFLNWFSCGAEILGVVFVKKGGIQKNLLHPPLKQLLNQPNMDLPLKFDRNYPQLPLDKNITSQFID
jgi:hypothetical protein